MSFAGAEGEMRERLMETFMLLNHIRNTSPTDFSPLDNVQKSMRGLWIVSLYAAFERSVNAIIEAAILEISAHGSRSIDCVPTLQSIIHYSKIQAVKDCGYTTVFDKSALLFLAAFSNSQIKRFDNPLTDRMMNIDGVTLKWLTKLFGVSDFEIQRPDEGRLGMLRERRNAVAHGREAASIVGERYTLEEMGNLYTATDRVSTAFFLTMKDYCTGRHYLRDPA